MAGQSGVQKDELLNGSRYLLLSGVSYYYISSVQR